MLLQRIRKVCVSLIVIGFLGLSGCSDSKSGQDGPIVLTDEAREVHASGLLFEGHNDLPWHIRTKGNSSYDQMDLSKHQPELQTDIPRLREGGVDAQFWIVYVPPETAREGTARKIALEQIDLIHQMVDHYPDDFELALSAEDVERIVGKGKIASLIGVEGGHVIENSLDTLREYYALGARYMGLTHSETIDWADSESDEPRNGGLSPFGEDVVREMNRLGMLVDLSHVSHDTMRDVMRVTKAPVIASHSGAYSVARHTRNVPDDVLEQIKKNNGVVMVVFFSGYIDPKGAEIMAHYFPIERELHEKYPDEKEFQAAKEQWRKENPIPEGTVRTVVDHIDYIVNMIGIDHVGLGGDYEGASKFPLQLEDVSGYPYITQELMNRGYSKEDIHKILGGNVLRALREAEDVSKKLQAEASRSEAKTVKGASGRLLIRGGTVIDGTGSPGRKADVLIAGDRIVRIGDLGDPRHPGVQVIDATGKVVTPGFIDAHCHATPLKTPANENFTAMGVTTVTLGQDGESPADLAGWMDRVERTPMGPNVAMFVGHGDVRLQAGVGLDPDPDDQQLAAMQKIVAEAMALGCFGLSSGIEYQPGMFANLKELVAVAKPVADAGGFVMSHIRCEDDDKIDAALDEFMNQGLGARCPVQVSHIKVAFGKGASRAEEILAKMQETREQGIRVTADIYPYFASFTSINIIFPEWAKPPHDYAEVVETRRAELEEYLRNRVTLRNGPEATLIGTEPWTGKTLAQVSEELGKPFEDVLIDDIGYDGARAAYFIMDPELQERFLVDPHVMICSDGSITSRHPRGHGTFARVIRKFVFERKLFSLEEAVRKMTGLTAETLGLDQQYRGRLEEGWFADVLVFDPAKVQDVATYENPHQLARGFDTVIINGKIVRENDQPTGVLSGRLLRHASGKNESERAGGKDQAVRLLPGFELSPYFGEQICTYAFDPDVTVHLNAPAPETFSLEKPVRVVVYALPNGNTIPQTIGRQKAEGVDWHYYIQHIGAQIRRMREVCPDETIVVAYVMADCKSWPTWRRTHENEGELIAQIIDGIRESFGPDVTIDLTAHSGGGSMLFGFMNHYDAIPDWVRRIVWLDAVYSYSDQQGHGDKLVAWLKRSPEHYLGVVSYDDREIEIDGKKIIGPTGGTYRKTHKMVDRLGKELELVRSEVGDVVCFEGANGHAKLCVIENPENRILHTVLVEKNGLIHALTFGTDLEGKAGQLWNDAAYASWIQPE